MADFTGQQCFGCGLYAPAHPMVAVLNTVDAGTGDDPLRFVAVPVCGPCHADPAHRQRLIKGTFFTPGQAADAVALAGERDKAGNPVRT
jgi:hypothetical protein